MAARRLRVAARQLLPESVQSPALPGQQLSETHHTGYTYLHPDAPEVFSQEQIDFYERNGFLIIRNNLPKADLDAYAQRFRELVTSDKRALPAGMQVVRDIGHIEAGANHASEATVNKISGLENDEILNSYAWHPAVLRWVPAWTGKTGAKVLPFTSMVVNKPPDAGSGSSRHPPHQDLWFWPLRPANLMVAAWTALEPCSRENGCLFALPGSHRGPLERHDHPTDGKVNAGFVGVEGACDESDVDASDYVWLEMAPGDTVFFHPLLKHGSGRNSSQATRKAISAHYASVHCIYFDTTQDPAQRHRAQRLNDTAARTRQTRLQQGGAVDDKADDGITHHMQMYRRQLRGGRTSPVVFGKEADHPFAI